MTIKSIIYFQLGVINFGSVRFLSKQVTKLNFFFLKNETGSNRPVSVRFGFLGQKPIKTGLAQFFRFWLGFLGFGPVFSGFGSVFLVWLGFSGLARFFSSFFWFRFGSVRFFQFFVIKPNRIGQFFQNFNRFFFRFGFFGYFFSGFLGLIGFSVFLLTPTSSHQL